MSKSEPDKSKEDMINWLSPAEEQALKQLSETVATETSRVKGELLESLRKRELIIQDSDGWKLTPLGASVQKGLFKARRGTHSKK